MTSITEMQGELRVIEGLSHRRHNEQVDGLLRAWAPLFEDGLARAVHGLSQELPGVEREMERAVGMSSRAGRRWRPMLTLLGAEICSGIGPGVVEAAVAVELTHTASLVLDDLPCMDDSELRRGEPATHRRLGSAGAILVAIGMLGRAAELLGSTSRPDLARDWGRMIGLKGMAGGQAIDLTGGERRTGSERRLHREKTVALSGFAAVAGARIAGGSPEACQALEGWGREVGWAYQLVDDAKDLKEDARMGRATSSRDPLRQADRLLGQADRGVRRALCFDAEATGMLAVMAERVVALSPPIAFEAHEA